MSQGSHNVTAVAVSLSAGEARRAQLWAQGLVGASEKPRSGSLLARVGAVQLDTISVLARSHELVAYARQGPVGRRSVERQLWGGDTFEYWSHAACVVPLSDWPLYAQRRELYQEALKETSIPKRVFKEVRAHLADGPATANEMGGAKAGGPWWDWSEVKRAVELLLGSGEVVCMSRSGFQRVYDLAARRVPSDLAATVLGPEECNRRMVAAAGRHLGVGTAADIADYFRMRLGQVRPALADSGLEEVRVDGWRDKAWASQEALGSLGSVARVRNRTTLVSPFDSLVWDRKRTERMFGFVHRLEAYVPRHKRVHGYYAMPVLAGGNLVGRVDPARRDGALVAKRVVLVAGLPASQAAKSPAQVARALSDAARWVGLERVVLEEVDPPQAAAKILSALSSS
jgi:uncharacterized protein